MFNSKLQTITRITIAVLKNMYCQVVTINYEQYREEIAIYKFHILNKKKKCCYL